MNQLLIKLLNKLIGKHNLRQLIVSPLHCALEKLQMITRLMIQLTQRYMFIILNRLGVYPYTICPLEVHIGVHVCTCAENLLDFKKKGRKNIRNNITSCTLAKIHAMTDEDDSLPKWKTVRVGRITSNLN